MLTEIFSKVGIIDRKYSLIASCGSGYAGTVLQLALLEAGLEAPLYDGSFSEWKALGKKISVS